MDMLKKAQKRLQWCFKEIDEQILPSFQNRKSFIQKEANQIDQEIDSILYQLSQETLSIHSEVCFMIGEKLV